MNLKKIREQFVKNPENLEIKACYYKTCYSIYQQADWDSSQLKELAQSTGMTVKEITQASKIYGMEYLHLSKEDYYYNIFSKHGQESAKRPNSKYNMLLEKLLHIPEDNAKEIIQSIQETGVTLEHLRVTIGNFVVGYYPTEADKIELELKRKVGIYSNYLTKIRLQEREKIKKQKALEREQEEKELLPLAQSYIQTFINGQSENKINFCENILKDSSEKEFDKMLKIIKLHDPALYQQYQKKVEDIQKKNYLFLLELTQLIYAYMKNGIPQDNGTVREFDIIDYFLLTNLNFRQFMTIIKVAISKEELNSIREFFDQNISSLERQPKVKKYILEERKIVNLQKDQYGNFVSKTERLITKEEKLLIFQFLEQIHLPINYKLYSVALRRYLNGSLSFESDFKTVEFSRQLKKRYQIL